MTLEYGQMLGRTTKRDERDTLHAALEYGRIFGTRKRVTALCGRSFHVEPGLRDEGPTCPECADLLAGFQAADTQLIPLVDAALTSLAAVKPEECDTTFIDTLLTAADGSTRRRGGNSFFWNPRVAETIVTELRREGNLTDVVKVTLEAQYYDSRQRDGRGVGNLIKRVGTRRRSVRVP